MTDAEIVAAEIRAAEVPMTDALGAALDRLEADAERYRWLKHKAPGEVVFDHINDDHRFELYVPFDGNPINNDEESNARLDASIDAAMAADVFGAV